MTTLSYTPISDTHDRQIHLDSDDEIKIRLKIWELLTPAHKKLYQDRKGVNSQDNMSFGDLTLKDLLEGSRNHILKVGGLWIRTYCNRGLVCALTFEVDNSFVSGISRFAVSILTPTRSARHHGDHFHLPP